MAPTRATFEILLDSPVKDVYSAGDRVSGRVCFASDEDHDVGKVLIQFWGRSKTKLYRRDGNGNRMTFRGRGSLFCQDVVLYNGQYTHKAPNFEWPFEFQFPETAQHSAYGDTWRDNHKIFRRSDEFEDIPLPSTMGARGQLLRVMHTFDCFVEYKLQASMTTLRSKKASYEDEIELPFVHLSNANSLSTQSTGASSTVAGSTKAFKVSSYKLDPQNSSRSLSFMEKARSILGSASVPSTNFQVTMDAPAAVRSGDKAAIALELNHLAQSLSTSSNPVVSLQSVDVSIIVSTSVRSKKAFMRTRENTSDREITCDVGLQTNSESWIGPFSKDAAYTKQLPLDDFHTLGLVPSFTTCNISRSYYIKAQCVFECAGKQVKLQKQDKIEIFPGLAQNAGELGQYIARTGSIAGSSVMADSILGDSTDQLPCYEDTGDSPPSSTAIGAATGREKPTLLQE